MTDDQETPAKTVELTPSDAATALMTRDVDRHFELDGHAQIYQHVVGLRAAMEQQYDSANEVVERDGWLELAATLEDWRDEMRDHVLSEHEHAVRWTLDPYDEMDE